MSVIKLFYFHPGCSMASHIALEESGLDYIPEAVNVADRGPLLKYNPKGTVPTLVVDDVPLTENVAILNYIARNAPQEKLAPEDPMGFAQCLSFLSWSTSSVHIAYRQIRRPERFSLDEATHGSIRALGRDVFWAALQTIDARLAQNPYIMGEQFTVADTYPMVFYNWARIAEMPIETLKNYAAFKDRMLARPAVRRVLDREGCKLIV